MEYDWVEIISRISTRGRRGELVVNELTCWHFTVILSNKGVTLQLCRTRHIDNNLKYVREKRIYTQTCNWSLRTSSAQWLVKLEEWQSCNKGSYRWGYDWILISRISVKREEPRVLLLSKFSWKWFHVGVTNAISHNLFVHVTLIVTRRISFS